MYRSCFPYPIRWFVPPFPLVAPVAATSSVALRFATFIGTYGFVRLLLRPSAPSRFPSISRYLFLLFPGDAEISQVPGESLCQRAPGSGLRRLVTTSHNGCSISVFRQAKNVDTATRNDFGADPSRPIDLLPTLHPHRSPHERQGSLPACPLRLWPGWILTNWIPLKGFRQFT